MSLFPFLDGITEEENNDNNELPLYKEYKWDFEANEFVLRDGKFIIVEGLEAVKIWIYKVLLTERYKWYIYSWDFGNEFKEMIGSHYSPELVKSEVARLLEECLLVNPYIETISDIEIDFKGDELEFNFIVNTVYGEVAIGVPRRK